MDGWEFTSKIVEAVAWPATVLVLVFKFSDRFRDLLGKLTEVTLPGGISGKFETPLDNAEQIARELNLEAPDELQLDVRQDPVALSANPAGVIMESWKDLEAMAAELLVALPMPGRDTEIASGKLGKDVLKDLVSRGLIPEKEVELLRELREIRNRAAHATKQRPTSEEAERFTALVGSLKVAWLVRIANALPR
ncbi:MULTISPECIES: DUF4145 domain-containing protein [Burkholderia cepacia complex]|uniref:DUF4145 domain-containing protein n=1 Tax=Burkholderia cepacia complex TaxID=87882 RepID=UPI000F5E36A1|nr:MULTISPECIES: DUF4145 domain-containing protein [Burkholderia cepacia complex]MCA8054354.1 DUF4145 domain-containing protein [Burkholderia cepacia]RQZ57996.1 DUF4145 domain-containing protein [Burkholderia cepacia]